MPLRRAVRAAAWGIPPAGRCGLSDRKCSHFAGVLSKAPGPRRSGELPGAEWNVPRRVLDYLCAEARRHERRAT